MVESRVRAMMVIFEDIVREEGGALCAGAVAASVGPFAGDSLDEALGFAVGLGAIRAGELVLDAEAIAGGGKGVGAVADAAVGEDALDGDAMEGVEADGLFEGGDNAGDLFVGQDTGVGDAGAVIDGDVQGLDAGAFAAIGAVARAAHPRTVEAAEFLDVEMEEFAGLIPLVTAHGRRSRLERGEAIEAVATQDA